MSVIRFLLTALAVVALPICAEEVQCPGAYDGHLQGIAADVDGNIYWSFTVALVKTDPKGTLLARVDVPSHHGDLWAAGGFVYAAVNHRAPQGAPRERESWVYAYHASDLAFSWKKPVPEVAYGVGGIAMRNGHYFLVSGRVPKEVDVNYVYEYDGDMQFVARHVLESGHTDLGVQTMAYAGGTWWFGCYGLPRETLCANDNLVFQERFAFECALGITPLPEGGFLAGRGDRNPERKYIGWAVTVASPRAATEQALLPGATDKNEGKTE